MLWFDQNSTVFLYDGSSNAPVQLLDAVNSPGSIDNVVFTLGSGSTAGQVIGAWRRGTDFGWVYVSGSTPVKVTATNPFKATDPMNPEAVAVADGCAFMSVQASSGNTTLVKHVFQVNPVTGAATLLTGGIPLTTGPTISTDGAPRISTSDCAAAWVFDDGSGTVRLQFYSGSTLTTVDSGGASTLNSSLRGFHLSHGKLVYEKVVAGIRQIFLYDSTATSPAPVQLTTDASGGNFSPRTDGSHVAWLHANSDGTQPQVVFAAGQQRTDATTAPANIGFQEHPFQLQRGQLLWVDAGGLLRYDDGSAPVAVDLAPSTTVLTPWLADGFAYWLGAAPALGANNGAFQFAATAPSDAQQPLPPFQLSATPRDRAVVLAWDLIAGASAYNVYLAEQPGVTKDNYGSLTGGRRLPVTGGTNTATVTGLINNKTYYFAISAVAAGIEGPSSRDAVMAPIGNWLSVGGLTNVTFYAVAADRTNGNVAYAAGGGNVYKTIDGGSTWTALTGGIATQNVRALAVDGQTVYAATPDGKLFKSPDGGASWSDTLPSAGGQGIGESNASIALDPAHQKTIYAGDFKLSSWRASDSYVIRSVDGGTNWAHLPNPTTPLGAELRAYALAVDPTGVVYAGGTGTPNLARSNDQGSTWSDVHIAGVSVFIYALALDSTSASTLYAGTLTQGIFKSGDSGTSWSAKDVGLGAALPQTRGLLADPLTPSVVHAGTSAGYAYSVDGGSHWIPGNTGALATATRLVNALALTASSKLIAGTDAGLFVLDRSIAAPPPASADLSVSGSANPNPATVGQNLTYTLTVANAGPDAANGVVLSDPLPAGLTFISAVATQGSCTGTSVVNCSLGTLTSGVSATVTITVSPTSVGTPANQAAVTSAVADPNSANNVATIVVTVVAQSGGGDGGTDGGGTVGGGGGGGGCATEGGCAGTLLALAGWLLLTSGRRRRSGVRLDNW